MNPRRGGWIRCLARRAGGQGLVEFVVAIPVFLVMMSGMYEFSRYYITRLTIRNAVAEGARYATTGNFEIDDETGDPIDRATSIRNTILQHTARFGVTSDDIIITPEDGGAPEEVVTVRLDYGYEVALPLMEHVLGTGIFDFQVSTSMRNEPFFN
jgi:Flp pilus assembly protein TadG